LIVLIRPSQPVRHFTGRRKTPPVFDHLPGLAWFPFPGNNDVPDTGLDHLVLEACSRVAAVDGDCSGFRTVRAMTR